MRLIRILVVGLLLAGVALLIFGRGERSAPVPEAQRLGRSTLSHGGAGSGSLPAAPAQSPLPARKDPVNQFPYATTR